MKAPKQASGGARLIAKGLHPVSIGVPKEKHEKMAAAAAAEGRSLAQFLIFHGMAAAEKTLKKIEKDT